MEFCEKNPNDNKPLLSRLLSGEEVRCDECNKGIYRPLNPKCEVNHCFVCDVCGSTYHWDPVIEID